MGALVGRPPLPTRPQHGQHVRAPVLRVCSIAIRSTYIKENTDMQGIWICMLKAGDMKAVQEG